MKEYRYKSIEQILDKINKEDSKKMDFARYFMIKKMGVDCDEDSIIAIGPSSAKVFMSLIASILIEWESVSNTGSFNLGLK